MKKFGKNKRYYIEMNWFGVITLWNVISWQADETNINLALKNNVWWGYVTEENIQKAGRKMYEKLLEQLGK